MIMPKGMKKDIQRADYGSLRRNPATAKHSNSETKPLSASSQYFYLTG